MNEMVGHIFGSLNLHEKAIGGIAEELKKQAKLNKRLVIFSLMTAAYMYVTNSAISIQNKKIEALTKEIEELKEVKEE